MRQICEITKPPKTQLLQINDDTKYSKTIKTPIFNTYTYYLMTIK